MTDRWFEEVLSKGSKSISVSEQLSRNDKYKIMDSVAGRLDRLRTSPNQGKFILFAELDYINEILRITISKRFK